MRIPDLDLELVRCFVTMVESGSFTQAAKRLRLTQSAIALKIKRLEDLKNPCLDTGGGVQDRSAQGSASAGYVWPALPVPTDWVGCFTKSRSLLGDRLRRRQSSFGANGHQS